MLENSEKDNTENSFQNPNEPIQDISKEIDYRQEQERIYLERKNNLIEFLETILDNISTQKINL